MNFKNKPSIIASEAAATWSGGGGGGGGGGGRRKQGINSLHVVGNCTTIQKRWCYLSPPLIKKVAYERA